VRYQSLRRGRNDINRCRAAATTWCSSRRRQDREDGLTAESLEFGGGADNHHRRRGDDVDLGGAGNYQIGRRPCAEAWPWTATGGKTTSSHLRWCLLTLASPNAFLECHKFFKYQQREPAGNDRIFGQRGMT